jgi:hypothetical protein
MIAPLTPPTVLQRFVGFIWHPSIIDDTTLWQRSVLHNRCNAFRHVSLVGGKVAAAVACLPPFFGAESVTLGVSGHGTSYAIIDLIIFVLSERVLSL